MATGSRQSTQVASQISPHIGANQYKQGEDLQTRFSSDKIKTAVNILNIEKMLHYNKNAWTSRMTHDKIIKNQF